MYICIAMPTISNSHASGFLLHTCKSVASYTVCPLTKLCSRAGVPTSKGRHEILRSLLSKMRHSLQDSEILELAAGTHGFVGADLSSLCHEAALSALRRSIQLKPKVSSSSTFASPTKSQSHNVINFAHNNGNAEVSSEKIDASATSVGSLCTALESVQLNSEMPQISEGFCGIREAGLTVDLDDFEAAKTRVRPSAMREVS